LEDRIEFKNLMEFLALFAGVKPVVRLTGTPENLATLENALSPFVECIERSPMGLLKVYSNDLSDSFYKVVSGDTLDFDLMVTFFGKHDNVVEALRAETKGCDDQATARTLGYPVCCARNYASIKTGRHWVSSYISGTHGIVNAPWQANKLAYLFAPGLTLLPDYFPCSVSCNDSWRLARDYHKVLCEQGLNDLESAVKKHLTGMAIILAGEILYVTDYAAAEQGWIDLKSSGHRLRFNNEAEGIPRLVNSVKALPGRLMFKLDDSNCSEIEITCNEEEGGILFS